MARTSTHNRLSRQEEQELLLDFFRSLGTLRGFSDVSKVVQDLLTRAELTMLAKRLKIAKLLIQGLKYGDISRQLKVSTQTIARINLWLQEAGDGFRLVFQRTPPRTLRSPSVVGEVWSTLRRRAPFYHWPELLVREILAAANRKQRERLYGVLRTLQHKGKLSRELSAFLPLTPSSSALNFHTSQHQSMAQGRGGGRGGERS